MVVHHKKEKPGRQKVQASLKGFSDARKSSSLLLKRIQQHIVVQAQKNYNVGRESNKIHVSELIKDDWCPRRGYYKLTGEPVTDTDNSINHRSETIFDTGHDAHRKWQKWIWNMGILWGSFECKKCRHKWTAISPTACPKCLSPFLRYAEVELEVDDLVGHADGAVLEDKAIVEVKTIGPGTVRLDAPDAFNRANVKTTDGNTVLDVNSLWNSIKRPFPSHLKQTMLYLWMAKRQGMNFDKVIFLYESKMNQATKEFVVPYSERIVQPYLERLEGVHKAVVDQTVPSRPDGFALDRKPCSNCLFRTTCYKEEMFDSQDQTPRTIRPRRLVPGGEETTGASADPSGEETTSCQTGNSRGSYVIRRPRTDGHLRSADEVGRVSGHTVGVRRGGRKVRGSRS